MIAADRKKTAAYPHSGAPAALVEDLVSIVMPAHDAASYIESAIESARCQTWTRWELIVVDDASRDGTRGIVERMAAGDSRVRLIRHETQRGPGAARNTGLDAARGRWLAFLDADDLWAPDKLEKQLAHMKRTGAVFSFTGYHMMGEDGRSLGRTIRVPSRIAYRGLLKNTIIGTTFSMFDRAHLTEMRMPDMRQHEDLALWLRILKGGVVAHGLQEPLASYRIVAGSNSHDKLDAVRVIWKLYRAEEKLGRLEAAWCLLHYAWNAYWKYRGLRV